MKSIFKNLFVLLVVVILTGCMSNAGTNVRKSQTFGAHQLASDVQDQEAEKKGFSLGRLIYDWFGSNDMSYEEYKEFCKQYNCMKWDNTEGPMFVQGARGLWLNPNGGTDYGH